jgi:3-hydroxyisobutyrate dehydrogenase
MRVGFVGLGAMGMHMARNLKRAGLLTAVWNRTAEKARTLAQELQVEAPAGLQELAAACDAVVSCVSADADVLEVTRALSTGFNRSALMLDCSTVSAETARQAAQLLEPGGV